MSYSVQVAAGDTVELQAETNDAVVGDLLSGRWLRVSRSVYSRDGSGSYLLGPRTSTPSSDPRRISLAPEVWWFVARSCLVTAGLAMLLVHGPLYVAWPLIFAAALSQVARWLADRRSKVVRSLRPK